MQRALGYIKDEPSDRDILFRTLLEDGSFGVSVREKVDLRGDVPNILDQEQLGSCVAHGGFGAIRMKHVLDGITDPKLGNRLHGYWGARAYSGWENRDSGSHIRNFFRFVNKHGFMPEEETEHGYDIETFKEAPSRSEMNRMYDQKNKLKGQVRYSRINEAGESRKEAMKLAMANKGVIEMGVGVTQRFMDHRGEGALAAPLDGERILGGHAFYLAGYNDLGVWKVSSWGDGWGQRGIGLLSWDYVLWEDSPDIWVVDEAPYYSEAA